MYFITCFSHIYGVFWLFIMYASSSSYIKKSFSKCFLEKLTMNTKKHHWVISVVPDCYETLAFCDNGGRLSVLFPFFWHPGLADICQRPDNGFVICSMEEAGWAFCGMWTCCKRNCTERPADRAGAREKSQHDMHHYLPNLETGND